MSDAGEIIKILAALPAELRASIATSAARGLAALKKPPDLSLARWAHRYFYLSGESSLREEKWRAWPFQIGILDCMGNDCIEEFTFFKSARLGYTKCLLALLGYTAQHRRRKQCIWQPTEADSDDFVKTDLDPMLRDVRIMRTVMPRILNTIKESTLKAKTFLGSILKMRGGKSAGNFRRLTLDLGVADELDGFDQSIEKAGPPDGLIRKRVEGATYPKCVFGSTGRMRGLSHIERLHKAADVRMRFCITCPHCQAEHPLEWGSKKTKFGIKWDVEDPEATVRHHCQHCHGAITQPEYLRLAKEGCWVSDCGAYRLSHWWDEVGEPCSEWTLADGTPCLPPRVVAMHCWTAYSPQVTWGKILREFLDAFKAMKEGNKVPMVAWVNETKGETYEEESEQADVNALQTRAKASGNPMRIVPAGGLLLGAGVDVQDNRFEIVVWAIGRGQQTWAIDYVVIDANPALESDWVKVWECLQKKYRHVNGAWMSLAGAAVDTGYGNYTHEAYSFVARYADRADNFKLRAVKGSSNDGDPIKARAARWMNINVKGRIVRRGVKLWMVGTDTAKDLFYGRLKVEVPGPGYVNFASDLPAEFFRQYGNEKRIKVRLAGKEVSRWYHASGANEVIDCTVYTIFMFEVLEVGGFTEKKWQQLESQVAPDLFDSRDVPENAALPLALEAETMAAPQTPAQPVSDLPKPLPQQRPQPAALPSASALSASNPFASSEWLERG
ncbi:phage terminase large subunit family protein [Polaromonas sp.]|uniref:phage terminase large subunit family protein n=1 Tax=Polaromonas sp. TaxID=1869339 RepID=UPI003561B768